MAIKREEKPTMWQQDFDLSTIKFTPLPEGLNHETGRGGHSPIAIVSHITDDMSINTVLDWFRNPQSKVSAHMTIDRDGTIYQLVSSTNTAWSNGYITEPNLKDLPWLQECIDYHINPNYKTIAIEHIGLPGTGITPAQFTSTVKLQTYLCRRYELAADRATLIGHCDLDSVTREYCPGPLFPWQAVRDAIAEGLEKE